MKELRSIISGMSEKEKKAARRYFAQKYANTKELRLFSILDQEKESRATDLESEVMALGYESSTCRSFQKLKVRLRHKIFDFLVTNSSLEGVREMDENVFLQQRLKKLNLQASVLLEKSYLNQSKDILNNTIRLAEENGQYQSAVEAMNELKKIHEIRANYAKKEKIEFRLKHCKLMAERIEELKDAFSTLRSRLDTDFLDFGMDKLRETRLLIQAHSNENREDLIFFLADHLQAMCDQAGGKYDEAFAMVLKWMKYIDDSPARIPVEHKVVNLQMMMENRILMNDSTEVPVKDLSFSGENAPLHLKLPLSVLDIRCQLLKGETAYCDETLSALEKDIVHPGRMFSTVLYQRVFTEFKKDSYRSCMDIINQHLRKFSCASYQQIDLMLLEIMCLYELGKLDVLEYRIQGFAKNLTYRKKFDLPPHYKICSTLLNNLLRLNFEFSDQKVLEQWSELRRCPVNGILLVSSYQPVFFLDWVARHAGASLPAEGEISMEALAAAIF